MTKAALKRRNARLIEKRDRMNELIDDNEQEIKELDSRESRELLEKFHIESEELAKLIFLRNSANKEDEPDASAKTERGRRAKSYEEMETEEPVRPWAEEDPEEQEGYDPLHMTGTKEEEQ